MKRRCQAGGFPRRRQAGIGNEGSACFACLPEPKAGMIALSAKRGIASIAKTREAPLQQYLFAQVEKAARYAGLGDALDAWGHDLELVRPCAT